MPRWLHCFKALSVPAFLVFCKAEHCYSIVQIHSNCIRPFLQATLEQPSRDGVSNQYMQMLVIHYVTGMSMLNVMLLPVLHKAYLTGLRSATQKVCRHCKCKTAMNHTDQDCNHFCLEPFQKSALSMISLPWMVTCNDRE